jgi:hypothetical protein
MPCCKFILNLKPVFFSLSEFSLYDLGSLDFFKFIIVYICMYSSDRYIIDIWKYNLDLNKL